MVSYSARQSYNFWRLMQMCWINILIYRERSIKFWNIFLSNTQSGNEYASCSGLVSLVLVTSYSAYGLTVLQSGWEVSCVKVVRDFWCILFSSSQQQSELSTNVLWDVIPIFIKRVHVLLIFYWNLWFTVSSKSMFSAEEWEDPIESG